MDERESIAQSLAAGQSIPTIAAGLGRTPSTLYRELARNSRSPNGHYSPFQAHKAYQRRRQHAKRPYRIESCFSLKCYVVEALKQTWSPQQIAGRLRRDHPRDRSMRLGFKTIYRWIGRDRAAAGKLYRHLRQGGGRYRKRYGGSDRRGQIPDRRPLSQRPAIAERRGRLGDFESDTIRAGRRPVVVTHVDRRSRYMVAAVLRDGRANTLVKASVRAFAKIPARLRHTLTADNGHEFSAHKRMEQALGMRVYFAPPYQAWRRATNENSNGLLREFIPKNQRRRPTHKELDRSLALLNNRPRKCLNWRTPAEVEFKNGEFH
jgi:IS30 family transposase